MRSPGSGDRKLRPRVSLATWRGLRAVGDLLIGILALALAFSIRLLLPVPFTASLLPAERLTFFSAAVLIVASTQNLILYFFGFYELPHPQQAPERLRRMVAAVATQSGLFAVGYFLTNSTFPRSVLLLFGALNLGLLLLLRAFLDRTFLPPLRRVAIVGAGPAAHELVQHVKSYPWYGLDVVGWVRAPFDDPRSLGPGEPLGSLEELPSVARDRHIDEVVLVSDPATWQTKLFQNLLEETGGRVGILLVPGPFESLLGRMHYRSLHDLPLIEVLEEGELVKSRLGKRLADVIIASLLLIAGLPLMLVCATVVKASSRGPMLYRQTRVGIHRRPFILWKLRTMRCDAEVDGEELLATPNDPRLTSIGALLRALRLDELPQLFNVLNGTMSMVGPRPERPGFVQRYLDEVPGYAARFTVRPGITGLAQVNGDYHTSAENKLRFDLAYVANLSLWLDAAILLRTVRTVLTSRGT